MDRVLEAVCAVLNFFGHRWARKLGVGLVALLLVFVVRPVLVGAAVRHMAQEQQRALRRALERSNTVQPVPAVPPPMTSP